MTTTSQTERPGMKPTVSIYQNPDYVAGILQQVNNQPLYTRGVQDGGGQSSDETKGEGRVDIEAQAKAGFSGIVSARGKGSAGGTVAAQQAHSAQHGHTWNWEYTQAAYLQLVREALSTNKLLKPLNNKKEAESLAVGDFVEFTASFRPSQISSLLDIATPELIEVIARRMRRSQLMKGHTGGNAQKENKFKLELEGDMDTYGAIAKAAMEAIRADFRSTTTREYYGAIDKGGDSVTAVTICDIEHFVVQDADRILDGTFSVLGKVTSQMDRDLPVLERNKILDRLNPELVDEATQFLNEQMRSASSRTMPDFRKNPKDAGGTGDSVARKVSDRPMVDATLDSRIAGPCVKIIPIAVYI